MRSWKEIMYTHNLQDYTKLPILGLSSVPGEKRMIEVDASRLCMPNLQYLLTVTRNLSYFLQTDCDITSFPLFVISFFEVPSISSSTSSLSPIVIAKGSCCSQEIVGVNL